MEYLAKERKKSKTYALAISLWLITVVLGVVSVLATHAIILRTYLRFFPGEAWAASVGKGSLSFLNILIYIPLGIVFIVIVIGGFEYQYKKMGQPQSWRLLARTLSVELAILLLALYKRDRVENFKSFTEFDEPQQKIIQKELLTLISA